VGGGPARILRGARCHAEICWSMSALFSIILLLFFCVAFLFVFWSFWGANMEPFCSPKSINMRLMSFFIFVDFLLICLVLLRLGRFYVGSISALCSYRFLHRFLVDFWVDLEVIFGAFGGSKSVIFWHRF
jgi:hypothetical protein